MIYCQSCGGPNPDGSRFCNHCGSAIADTGAPGGPLPGDLDNPHRPSDGGVEAGGAAASGGPTGHAGSGASHRGFPSSAWAMHDQRGATHPGGISSLGVSHIPHAAGGEGSHVSLGAIGVQSAGRTWLWLTLGALAMAGVGAGIALALAGTGGGTGGDHGEPLGDGSEPRASSDALVAGDGLPPLEEPPVDFGLPHGAALPDDGFLGEGRVVSGGSSRGAGSTSGTSSGSAGSRRSGGGAGRGGGSSGGGGSGDGSSPTGSGGSAGGSGSAGSGGSSSGGSGSGGRASDRGGSSGGGSDGDGSSDGSGGRGSGVGEGEAPIERDLELDLYSARVRYVVRRYYAARARSCFEAASRNDPDLHGTVVVRFGIGASGEVRSARVVRNDTGSDQLAACVATRVREWRLPAPPGGAIELEMPFSA